MSVTGFVLFTHALYELQLDREEIAAILIFEGYWFKRFVICGILPTLNDVSFH
jgi:hypothetical protein